MIKHPKAAEAIIVVVVMYLIGVSLFSKQDAPAKKDSVPVKKTQAAPKNVNSVMFHRATEAVLKKSIELRITEKGFFIFNGKEYRSLPDFEIGIMTEAAAGICEDILLVVAPDIKESGVLYKACALLQQSGFKIYIKPAESK